MPTDILQAFLDRSLLDLGDGTDKFTYLTSAAADVAGSIAERRLLLLQASSLLIGGTFNSEDAVLQLCEQAVKSHWQTYGSRFAGNTNQLFRAVLLQAVSDVTAGEDHVPAAIVLYAASSAKPFLTAQGEDDLFSSLLTRLGERVEEAAERIWVRPTDAAVPNLEHDDATAAITPVAAKALTDALKAAAGPSAGATGANPHWPGANNQEWLDFYAKGSAEAVVGAINNAQKSVLSKAVAQARTDDGEVVDLLRTVLSRNSADHFRTDLLYWKECLFSSSLKRGYRKLAPDSAAFRMAYDLHLQLPTIHAHSVEFFLRETVRAAFGDDAAEAPRPIAEVAGSIDVSATRYTFNLTNKDRMPLLAAALSVAAGTLSATDIGARTGLPLNATCSREDLAVWFFRDLQATRLAGGA